MQSILKTENNVKVLASYNVYEACDRNEVFIELLSCNGKTELPLADGFAIAHVNCELLAEAVIKTLHIFSQNGQDCESLFEALKKKA